MRVFTRFLPVVVLLGVAGAVGADEEWRPPPPPEIAEIVDRADEMPVEAEKLLIWNLQRSLERRVLAVPPGIAREYARYLGHEDAGVNRILERGNFDKLTTLSGDGAYFSFLTRSNDYQEGATIELQQGCFMTGFAGRDYGFIEALPVSDIEAVDLADLPERFRESPDFQHRGRRDRVEAKVGRVYAVRAILWEEGDVVAALKILDRDDHGLTFVWKIVKRYDVPLRPGR
jgi:hypothetical protein